MRIQYGFISLCVAFMLWSCKRAEKHRPLTQERQLQDSTNLAIETACRDSVLYASRRPLWPDLDTLDSEMKPIVQREQWLDSLPYDRADSIRLTELLSHALKATDSLRFSGEQVHYYPFLPEKGVGTSELWRMQQGEIFKRGSQHLILLRKTPGSVVVSVFSKKGRGYKHLCSDTTEYLGFIKDSVGDVNGDGWKDLLVHSYSSAGCCRRNVYNVHLYKSKTNTFSQPLRFMNPLFLPKLKLVRGVKYGHRPPLYTYRWKGWKTQVVEYLFQDESEENLFYRTKSLQLGWDSTVPHTKVYGLPEYYKSLPDIDVIWQ